MWKSGITCLCLMYYKTITNIPEFGFRGCRNPKWSKKNHDGTLDDNVNIFLLIRHPKDSKRFGSTTVQVSDRGPLQQFHYMHEPPMLLVAILDSGGTCT